MRELGSIVTDRPTGLDGMVTRLQVEMNGNEYLLFQPRGLSPKTGLPVADIWLVEERLTGPRIKTPDLPTHVLGTEVEDIASGFKGMAVSLMYYINGCVHINVQAKGLQDTGAPIELCNFDIRRLKGEFIPQMTKEEQALDQTENPSPAGDGCYSPSR